MRLMILALLLFGFSSFVMAFPGGAGTCEVVANFSTITGMGSRVRNQNNGDYELTTNVSSYNSFEHVEITLSANGDGDQSTFTGLVVSVVDEAGDHVGTFNFDTDPNLHECGGAAMMGATHTGSHASATTRTLFWVPPSETVGDVYVLAYVLSGVRNNTLTQQFYRFVRNDGAVTLEESDVIFLSGFE